MYGYRIGKNVVVGNRSTPEQAAALQAALLEQKQNLPNLMRTSSEQLLALIADYDPLMVLGFIFHVNYIAPQFRGKALTQSFAQVEHLALLLAKDHRPGTVPAFDAVAARRVQEILREQQDQALVLAMPEPLSAEATDKEDALRDALAVILFFEMGVRGERYADQQEALIADLFIPFNANLRQILGFNADDAIAIDHAYERRIRAMATEGIELAQDYMADIDRVLKDKAPKDSRATEMVAAARAAGLTSAEVRDYSLFNVILWLGFRTGYSLAPTIDDLVAETGLQFEIVNNAMQHLTIRATDLPEYWQLGAGSYLKRQPLVAINDYYALPTPSLFLEALQTLFEGALKKSPTWEQYQKHRSDYGVDRTVQVFARALPGAQVYRNLRYKGSGLEGDVDVLVAFEKRLFLIEVKSGDFAAAARAGVASRVESALGDLVLTAYDQTERAARYINRSAVARFRNGDSVVEIQKKDFDRVYLIGVTLEQLGHVVNTAGSYLREGKMDPPWTVSIDDLDVIADLLKRPAEFLHYISRRRAYLSHSHVRNADEMGFLESYLRDSLQADMERFRDYTHVMLEAESPKVDEYRNAKAVGVERTPPKHELASEIGLLLDKLSEQRPNGWLDASTAILDLIPRHQRIIARAIAALSSGKRVHGITQDESGLRVAKFRIDDPRCSAEELAPTLTVDQSLNVLSIVLPQPSGLAAK